MWYMTIAIYIILFIAGVFTAFLLTSEEDVKAKDCLGYYSLAVIFGIIWPASLLLSLLFYWLIKNFDLSH